MDLFEACEEGRAERVSALIEAKTDVNAVNEAGDSAILSARQGHDQCVLLLIGVPGINVNNQDGDGDTALVNAAWNDHVECVQKLIGAPGIEIGVKNKLGNTALILAVDKGHEKCVRMLLEAKCNVNAQNKKGDTALMNAILSGHNECICVLSKTHGVNVNAQNRLGHTAVSLAAKELQVATVRLLLEAKADANIPDNKGKTPLHRVLDARQCEMIKLLVERDDGAKLDALDKYGKRPLQLARGRIGGAQAADGDGADRGGRVHACEERGEAGAPRSVRAGS